MTPIGAGMYSFPIEISLQNIIEAIHDFFKNEPVTSLQQIFLTSIQTEEVREMIKQLKISFEDKVKVIRTELDEKMAGEGSIIRKRAIFVKAFTIYIGRHLLYFSILCT